jgi:PPK2 family polyphosphate:nucleotide phosphotransferase
MPREEVLDLLKKYVTPYRITKGKGFRLKDFDPGDTGGLQIEKAEAADLLQAGTAWLAEEQDMLYAQDRWSLLLVFQAMDAAGKDGTINHVMSGVNPQGCQVFSFKQPSSEEIAHDFMWRYARRLPERGRIGIFNRSYYEEVLVVRVHPELLERQKPPQPLVSKRIWDKRLADIAHFEDYAARQGTKILKFFLHVSRKEQKKRFMERLEEPEKNWKFSASDVQERKFWGDYMRAFEEAIAATASKQAPWFVVPADNKWAPRRRGNRGGNGEPRSRLPEGRRGEEEGACGRGGGTVPRALRHFQPCATPISGTTLPRPNDTPSRASINSTS